MAPTVTLSPNRPSRKSIGGARRARDGTADLLARPKAATPLIPFDDNFLDALTPFHVETLTDNTSVRIFTSTAIDQILRNMGHATACGWPGPSPRAAWTSPPATSRTDAIRSRWSPTPAPRHAARHRTTRWTG